MLRHVENCPAPPRGNRLREQTDGAGRVLVVTDDPTVRYTATGSFEQRAVPTSVASGGHELYRRLATAEPTLVMRSWLP
jgi:hypothetical protein